MRIGLDENNELPLATLRRWIELSVDGIRGEQGPAGEGLGWLDGGHADSVFGDDLDGGGA